MVLPGAVLGNTRVATWSSTSSDGAPAASGALVLPSNHSPQSSRPPDWQRLFRSSAMRTSM
jgi:hypothetical protein